MKRGGRNLVRVGIRLWALILSPPKVGQMTFGTPTRSTSCLSNPKSNPNDHDLPHLSLNSALPHKLSFHAQHWPFTACVPHTHKTEPRPKPEPKPNPTPISLRLSLRLSISLSQSPRLRRPSPLQSEPKLETLQIFVVRPECCGGHGTGQGGRPPPLLHLPKCNPNPNWRMIQP